MANTTFVDKVTVIATEWLNEANTLVHSIFGNATTKAAARSSLAVPGLADNNVFTGTASIQTLTLTNDLAVTEGGTGASSAAVARTNLGSSATGDAIFIAATSAAARATLGSSATGDAIFIAATTAVARTALGSGSTGDALFLSATPAAAQVILGTPFTKSYLSAAQTVTTAGGLTLAHGLGEIPKLISVTLTCLVAESGYSIGDVLIVNPQVVSVGQGLTCTIDATNLSIRFSSGASVFAVNHKTSGTVTNTNNTSFSVTFRAFA